MNRYKPNDFPATLREFIIKAGKTTIRAFGWSWGAADQYDGDQYTLNDWRKILEDAEMWEKAENEFMAFVLSGK